MGNTSNKAKGGDPTGGLDDWKGDKVAGSQGSKDDEETAKLPALDIFTINDLPNEYQLKISKAGLTLEQCQTNLPALLSILHFLYKRRFKLRKAAEEKPELSVAPSTETEEQAFDTVLQAEVLDGPEASEAAPSSPVDSTRPTSSDEITPDDLAREARSISEGDPMTLFTKFVSHGQGGFGRVDKAKHIKSKSIMAIKRMPHTTVKQRKANMQEVHFLRLLRGKPNIVNYYATFRKGEEVWVIMEFMEGGTLGQAASKRALNEGHVAYLAREILKGLSIVHGLKLAHRDLKPHNIMIDIDGAVKLIDFGLCIDLNKNKEPRNMVGSAYWMAPEMILRKPHGTAVDIWSFGIVMFEVLLGKPITHHVHPIKAMFTNAALGGPPMSEARAANAANISTKSESSGDDIFGGLVTTSKTAWSENAYDFVQSCLVTDPSKRPTAADLLKHPFLKAASDQKEMRRILKVLFLSDSLSANLS